MANYTKAFTLVELLVAMTIIMVLTIVAVVNYGSVQKNARDSKRKADLEKVRVALEMYRQDHDGCYPSDATTLTEAGHNYLDVLPGSDPKAMPYCYVFQGSVCGASGVSEYALYTHMESEKNQLGTYPGIGCQDPTCPTCETMADIEANYKVINP